MITTSRRRFPVTTMLCAAAFSCLVFLSCGPLPTDVGNSNLSIRLYLEDGTKTAATYSGEPIKATITLPDSFVFEDIAWHLGNGHYQHPGIAPGKKLKTLDVELFWTSFPACKDTATKQLYDTLYVSVAGETMRSNRVRVNVTNVPPVIDSIKIGTAPGRSDDTIRYTVTMNDTSSNLAIKAAASDMNRDTLKYDWYSFRGVNLAPVALVQYQVPKSQFADTVVVTVYDGKGGQSVKVICLSKLPSNSLPVIDSIRVGSRTFAQDTTFHVYSARQLDTVRLTLYSHDPDAGDVISVTWSHKNARDSLIRTVSNRFQVALACDSLYKKPFDSLRTVDTVTITVKDVRGDSAKATIRFVQGYINTPPKLDSIRVNGLIQCKGTTVLSRDSVYAWARDTFTFRVFSTDLDSGDTVKLSVKAKQNSLVTRLSDTTAQYVCKDSAYTDTVVFSVKDLSGDSVVKKIVISVINRPPALDSIRVDGVMQCRGAVSLFRDTAIASSIDTVTLRIFASDRDPGDTVKLNVSAKQVSCVTKLSDTSVQYVCRDSIYTDTVVCCVKDVAGDSAIKKIVISIIDRPPTLDSIRVNGITQCKGTIVTSLTNVSGRDTVLLRTYASDPDKGDSVTTGITSRLAAGLTVLSDTTARYVCKDSLYSDTVACVAKDLLGDSVKKSIVIAVINRPPRCDSISVIDTIAHDTIMFMATDSLVSGRTAIKLLDSVKVRLFAHDPDLAPKDSIAQVQWSLTSGRTVKLLDAKGLFVRYPAPTNAGVDTVSVRITDTKQKSARMSLIFEAK